MTAELWVELVKALAWPLTVVGVLFALRKHIAAAASKVGKFKYGEFEFELNQSVTQVEQPATNPEALAKEPTTPNLSADERQKVEGLALEAVEEEFGELKRHVRFFDRQDLFFDGAAVVRDRLTVFEVVILGEGNEYPKEHIEAVSARFRAVRQERHEREIHSGHLKLVFLFVTDLSGDGFLALERKLRSTFEHRTHEDVRLYHRAALLAAEKSERGNKAEGE